jgi:hypothetical protein
MVKRSFLVSHVSTRNTTLCRVRHIACDMQIGRACVTVLREWKNNYEDMVKDIPNEIKFRNEEAWKGPDTVFIR